MMVRGHMLRMASSRSCMRKTIPAQSQAWLRLHIPRRRALCAPSCPAKQRRDISIQDVFEGVGAHARGRITDAELPRYRRYDLPGAEPAAASSVHGQ